MSGLLKFAIRLIAVGFFALACGISPAWAQVAPPLGAAQQFGLLGNSGVTGSTGLGTVVNGDVGSYPTPAITNFGPSRTVPPFTVHLAADTTVQQAHTDAKAAYDFLAAQGGVVTGAALTGTIGPGIYALNSADLAASTTLTLNGAGVWIFNIATTLVMNSSSVVIGTANPCNVFWRVGTSATLNGTAFIGTVIADASISVGAGSTVAGRLLAGTGPTGAVTLAGAGGNTIGGCSVPPACPIVSISSPITTGAVGVSYSQTLAGVGGTAGYTFSLAGGFLPPGLALTPAGVLSGVPTTPGSYPLTVRAADGTGCPGLTTFTITISGTPILRACPALPTITSIPTTQAIPVSGSVAVPFSISGPVIADALVVTATSADPTLVPPSAMVITRGVGGARVLTVSGADGRTGVTTISVTVSDPSSSDCTTTSTFELRVGVAAVPTLPQWSMIGFVGLLTLAGIVAMRRREG
jgi:hypothetical protein